MQLRLISLDLAFIHSLRLTNHDMLRFALLGRVVQMEDFLGSGRQRQQYLLDTYYRPKKPRHHDGPFDDALVGSNVENMWTGVDSFVGRIEQGLLEGVIKLSAAIDSFISGMKR